MLSRRWPSAAPCASQCRPASSGPRCVMTSPASASRDGAPPDQELVDGDDSGDSAHGWSNPVRRRAGDPPPRRARDRGWSAAASAIPPVALKRQKADAGRNNDPPDVARIYRRRVVTAVCRATHLVFTARGRHRIGPHVAPLAVGECERPDRSAAVPFPAARESHATRSGLAMGMTPMSA